MLLECNLLPGLQRYPRLTVQHAGHTVPVQKISTYMFKGALKT